MKKFFSLQSVKENKIFYIWFSIIIILSVGITRTLGFPQLNYFDLKALIIAFIIWGLSCAVDKEKYFNIGTMVASLFFGYGILWFCLEIVYKL